MRVVRLRHPKEFLELATPLLVRHEVENGLMLGVAAEMAALPEPPDAFWAVTLDGDEPVAAAARTGGKLLLSVEPRAGGIAALCSSAMQDGTRGIIGPGASVHAFADVTMARLAVAWEPGRPQRIYSLQQVIPPRPAPGSWRLATSDELELLIRWADEFGVEAIGTRENPVALRARVIPRAESGAFYLWEDDGQPVSMAGAFGPTPRGIRIGAVYTPPAHRGRGYATSLVAAVSQAQLDGGREFTFLYTDLGNPTSNAIYQRIGYETVADAVELQLRG